MIEEQALVIAVEKGAVVVQTQRASTCGSCATKQGCGTSALAKGMGKGYTELRVVSDLDVNVGDTVILAIDESSLLKGAVFVYLLPLIAMILGGITGDYCANLFALNSEWLSIVFGVAGLVGSLLLIRLNPYAHRFQQQIQPRMVCRKY
ncbi:MAG TPA: Fis family transcriptional regulator [Chromatiaceae bacterium]|jgi:sigma-E factor negative regulatory protein RseC|nr:Fis family transcriptional regulator [Chromatiaceae bacterium]HIB84019.1 Fis family transcriptional regulator [Chromatiaceae bacterium]HIN81991.1 Fis family transcriptional regulator [Chromatiales bacterium]HIO14118.1 Fis family transcriptional regulator [Chromatiales bacterium]HIO54267.1 Fis family transcriptional regulator [Chromatiales bacterium]